MWGHRCAKVSLVPHGVHPRGLRSGCDYCMCRDSCTVYPPGFGHSWKTLVTEIPGVMVPRVHAKGHRTARHHSSPEILWESYGCCRVSPGASDPDVALRQMSSYLDRGLKVHGTINVQKSVTITTQLEPEA